MASPELDLVPCTTATTMMLNSINDYYNNHFHA